MAKRHGGKKWFRALGQRYRDLGFSFKDMHGHVGRLHSTHAHYEIAMCFRPLHEVVCLFKAPRFSRMKGGV